MEPGAPHALRGLKNALFGRLARPTHGGARRATTRGTTGPRPTGSTSTCTFTTHARGRVAAPAALIEKAVDPEAGLLAHDVGVVRGRDEGDRLGRARVQVRSGVHALLHRVRRQLALVVDHDVVRRLDRPLQARVRLQVKVEVEHGRHALVDDRARARVPVSVREFRVGRVEARVVPLAADDDAQRRVVPRVLGVDALERLEDLGQLFLDHLVVLALRARVCAGSVCNSL